LYCFKNEYEENNKYYKMTSLKKILTLAQIALPLLVFGGKDISQKSLFYIHMEALKVLREYEARINEIGEVIQNNDVSKAIYVSEELISLFTDRHADVFNDLDRRYCESYEIETYTRNLMLRYKAGIEVALNYDKARFSRVYFYNSCTYIIDVTLPKSTNGLLRSKERVINSEELTFRLVFEVDKYNKPENMKIAGVRKILKTAKGKNIIESEIETKLNDYVNFLSLVSDAKEKDSDKTYYREKFISLFAANAMLWNDIEPYPDNISANEYVELFEKVYGAQKVTLSFEFDSLTYNEIQEKNRDELLLNIGVVRHFSSVDSKGKMEYVPQRFLIDFSFTKTDEVYSDFKIANIRSSIPSKNKVSLVSVNDRGSKTASSSNTLFELSVYGGAGQNKFISSDLLDNRNGFWNATEMINYHLGVSASCFLYKNIVEISSGIEVMTHESKYSIHEYTLFSDVKLEDVNNSGMFYVPEVEAMPSYDSLLQATTFSVPFSIGLHYFKFDKFGVFANIGGSISFLNASYSSKGTYEITGELVDKEANNPDDFPLSFLIQNTNINVKNIKRNEYSTFSFSAQAKLGVEYFIGYFTSIKCGVYYSRTITDIEIGDSYYDVVGESYEHKPTFLENKGLFLGLAYKL